MKRYTSFRTSDLIKSDKNYLRLLVASDLRKVTELELLKYPSKTMNPFNLSEENDAMIPNISIDFVSFPKIYINHDLEMDRVDLWCDSVDHPFPCQKFNEYDVSKYEILASKSNYQKSPLSIEDLIVRFKLKVYEYDDYNLDTDSHFIDPVLEKDLKLERMLKILLKLEQGVDVTSLKPNNGSRPIGSPPKYEESENNFVKENQILKNENLTLKEEINVLKEEINRLKDTVKQQLNSIPGDVYIYH